MAGADDRRTIEYLKCAADAAYFTNEYGIIDDAQGHGDGGGVMPFHLWPAQTRVLWQFLQHRLFIILKARQLGISWLCCSYALWLCLFHPGKVVLLFSQGENEAMELLRRVRVLYERLPDWFRESLPALVKENTEILQWSNGSLARSLPASKRAGRSFTASLVILDEAAFLTWAKELYTALKPTIDGGGQLIILSTANGIGNLFHLLWTRAESKLNQFIPIFLPWWARPGRTADWYEAQKSESPDPALVKQEYPASAQEAFVASGRVRFPEEWVSAQSKNVMEAQPLPKPPKVVRDEAGATLAAVAALRFIPDFTFYKAPVPGRKYVIGADVAEGNENGDFSDAVVIDAETWEEMAGYHGHCEPDVLAGYLMAMADAYNGATIAVERNNHGHAVLATLKLKGARGVFIGPDGKRGWLTNSKTKEMMIDLLAEALRDELMVIRSAPTLSELKIYQINDDGTTSAPEGYHDDRVMSRAVALQAARRRRRVLTEDNVG